MQPTGRDEQGDEDRRRALEAAVVARAEDNDWSSFREVCAAVAPCGVGGATGSEEAEGHLRQHQRHLQQEGGAV